MPHLFCLPLLDVIFAAGIRSKSFNVLILMQDGFFHATATPGVYCLSIMSIFGIFSLMVLEEEECESTGF